MRSAIQDGHFVEYRSPLPGSYRHSFCGTHRIRGAVCPNCQRALLRLLNLDLRDPCLAGLGLDAERVPLLFCWSCGVAEGGLRYRIVKGGVELVGRTRGGGGKAPYPDYPTAFPPAPARLIAIPAEVQGYIRGLNGENRAFVPPAIARTLATPQHQVGGEPFHHGEIPVARCSSCRRRMTFVASVCDDCLDPRGFTGDARMQLIYSVCRGCQVIYARLQD